MGNLSAEQEQGLLAGMAEKVEVDAPSSPNATMREESILAGLGVIAPEEIGLRRNKCAPDPFTSPIELGENFRHDSSVRPLRRSMPARGSGGGLLAQLRQRRDSDGLWRETPARSGEGSGLLAQLRAVSSSEEAGTRNGSAAPSHASTIQRQLSAR